MADSTGHPDHAFTRRIFLGQGMTFASLAATTPMFLDRSALAVNGPLDAAVSSRAGVPEDHVLVVVQLSGGNDGLNTVVPYGSPDYQRLRGNLALRGPRDGDGGLGRALELDPNLGIGLHPNLDGLKSLFDDGCLSIVQGVGYPNPNRSHFTSMDTWHSADPGARSTGWIGRYFDNQCSGSPEPMASVSLGNRAPLAMVGDETQPVSFEKAERYRWLGGDLHEGLTDPYDDINSTETLEGTGDHPHLGFLTRTALDAQVSSDQISKASSTRPLVEWPRGPLAGQLRMVAAMLRSKLKTRVFYTSLGGFDTHANQAASHGRLMRQLGDSLSAFQRELRAQGDNRRVMTMVFSEFGRRVARNASGGTDHGTAAPMYFMGDMVRPGLLGEHPSLTDLDRGDLKFTVDFRSIYSGILKDWMGCDPRQVIKGSFEPAKIIRQP
ncbi:MAG: DUF1501 domain-containing protein [Phycisphaerales bacterium]